MNPYSVNCKLEGSGCGDGTIDEGEECEIGGVGCSSDCTCEDGYKPQSPAAVNCVPSGGDEDKLKEICRSVADPSQSGYVCLSGNATEYLRCALSGNVFVMMPCAPGTRCKASTGVFQIYNPCLWEQADYPVILPDSNDDKSDSDSSDDGEEEEGEKRKYSSEEDSRYVPVNCKFKSHSFLHAYIHI